MGPSLTQTIGKITLLPVYSQVPDSHAVSWIKEERSEARSLKKLEFRPHQFVDRLDMCDRPVHRLLLKPLVDEFLFAEKSASRAIQAAAAVVHLESDFLRR